MAKVSSPKRLNLKEVWGFAFFAPVWLKKSEPNQYKAPKKLIRWHLFGSKIISFNLILIVIHCVFSETIKNTLTNSTTSRNGVKLLHGCWLLSTVTTFCCSTTVSLRNTKNTHNNHNSNNNHNIGNNQNNTKTATTWTTSRHKHKT